MIRPMSFGRWLESEACFRLRSVHELVCESKHFRNQGLQSSQSKMETSLHVFEVPPVLKQFTSSNY